MRSTNVAVFVPDTSVSSMQDEVQDGSVDKAVTAAVTAYQALDSDGNVPVIKYSGDFDDAIAAAEQYANSTDGDDLIVVVTDLVCDDPKRAESVLAGSDNMWVIVPVSNQGYDTSWADKLDNDQAGPNNVDVVEVSKLADPTVALAEVREFLAKSA